MTRTRDLEDLVFNFFGSDRSQINADLCSSVRASGSSLSRALNLHLSISDLQAFIKGSSMGLQRVFKGSSKFKGSSGGLLEVFLQALFNINIKAIKLTSYHRSLKYFVLLSGYSKMCPHPTHRYPATSSKNIFLFFMLFVLFLIGLY